MRLIELFESATDKKIIVIFPGRFQPFHIGHKAMYDSLCAEFGTENVFIVTSNKVELPNSPFSFKEKMKMMLATGVSNSSIELSVQPYQAPELVSQFDKNNSIVIFGISEKDMADNPRFKFGKKKDGSPTYLQPFVSLDECETQSTHAYIYTMPTVTFTVLGKPAKGATQIRELYRTGNPATRKRLISDLYGKFDTDIYKLFNKNLTAGELTESAEYAKVRSFVDRNGIKKYEVLNSDGVTVKQFSSKQLADDYLIANRDKLNK